ncbi:SGS domain-containing protein [Limtongia smithiae]|uniref:SGS domain-containing protein n=1 Tax=Limtongia smithiae TaxID=1125753 RepID=UPI0034CFCCC9
MAAPKVRHEWYQTADDITFTLFVKNAPKTADVSISPESLSVTYPLPTGSDFAFDIGPLAYPILPSSSRFLILTTKIEFKLRKSNPGVRWAALEAADVAALEQSATAAAKMAPSSSRQGAKNWDAVATNAANEVLTGDEETSDEAASFFKKLYEGADEDTKRAMMKSYVESNGTALSTNWSDVKKETVKTEPPKGMQANKW